MWGSSNQKRGDRSVNSAVANAAAMVVEGLEQRRLFSTAYALLGSGGTLLASFDTTTPNDISVKAVTGLTSGEKLGGIDFRPSTGELYALGLKDTAGDTEGRIYIIDPSTGAATLLGPGAFITSLAPGASYGFDFNPA